MVIQKQIGEFSDNLWFLGLAALKIYCPLYIALTIMGIKTRMKFRSWNLPAGPISIKISSNSITSCAGILQHYSISVDLKNDTRATNGVSRK